MLVLARGRSTTEEEDKINESLECVSDRISWLGLSLAINKTEAIYFCSQRSMGEPKVIIYGETVEVKKVIKYLGTHLYRSKEGSRCDDGAFKAYAEYRWI
jgi:hypothetical protein